MWLVSFQLDVVLYKDNHPSYAFFSAQMRLLLFF